MILLAVGCSYRNTPVEVRERLAFNGDQLAAALDALTHAARLRGRHPQHLQPRRAVPRPGARQPASAANPVDAGGGLPRSSPSSTACRRATSQPHLYIHRQADAVRHLFRVAASLDSLIVGEGQIAGQVKKAYELAQEHASAGPLLHALFRHARQVARRVRTETGIAQGHVSVSSAAVDYVRQVFDHFGDKTILVIGAGKMGELTLRHLRQLQPRRILVTNRSPEKAAAVARGLRRRGGAVGAARRAAGPRRHRAEHDRRAGADRDARALRQASPPSGRRPGGDPRHRRAARLRPGHPRRRPHLPVQHRRSEAHPRRDAGRPPQARRAGRGDRRAGGEEVSQRLGAAAQRRR